MTELQAPTQLPTTSPQAEAKLPAIRGAAAFELLQRAAKALSLSSLVPEGYRNNLPNCMIALRIADRIGADPMMVMQNLDIVHGRPSWRAQFLIGTANSCGRFSAIRYEFFGDRDKDSWGCRAWAVEKSTEEKLVGPDITIAIAKQEGWYNKNGSKWKTIPQLMLMYRAGAWWVRAYAPELSLGFQTAEEQADIIDVTARAVDGDDALRKAASQLGAAKGPEVVDDDADEVSDDEAEAPAEDVIGDESSLDRGVRLLGMCKTVKDVNDLQVSITEELSDAEVATFDQYVATRRKEIVGK